MRFDAWSIGVALLVLGIAVLGIKFIARRIEEQRYREDLAEMEFEQTLLSSAASSNHDSRDSVFLQDELASEPGKTVVTFAVEPTPIPYQNEINSDMVAADVAAVSVIEKLKMAGLLRTIEGYIDVHGNPKGAVIILLRSGKRALLVPHMESEFFFRRNSKRVDFFIVRGTDGNDLVVSALSSWLAENV